MDIKKTPQSIWCFWGVFTYKANDYLLSFLPSCFTKMGVETLPEVKMRVASRVKELALGSKVSFTW